MKFPKIADLKKYEEPSEAYTYALLDAYIVFNLEDPYEYEGIKEIKKEDHEGQIYNPVTGRWSWL